MEIKFSKEKISVQSIGVLRFWYGIAIGFLSAVLLSLAFNYFRELLRFFSTLSGKLINIGDSEADFYNYHISLLAIVLGLSISISIWMNNHNHRRRKELIYKQVVKTNNLLLFWVVLMLIARFGSTLTFIFYGNNGYSNEINFIEEYKLVLILITIVIFLQSWFIVRLVYRSIKWVLMSLLICLVLAFIFEKTTSVNHKIIDKYYLETIKFKVTK